MIPSDSASGAREQAGLFTDPRIQNFYDGRRALGRAYVSEVFADCADQALAALPPDHEMRDQLESWKKYQPRQRALWDAFLGYAAGVSWSDRVPAPAHWTKQVDFFMSPDGNHGGVFFAYDCSRIPHHSDWFAEVRALAENVLD